MLSATTNKRLDSLGEISRQGKRVNGLFRLMENPVLWEMAYVNIYSNKGAMTKGVDGSTMDGFSNERTINIINTLKNGEYRFKPARRVYIPKQNGNMRPLGIPSGNDKLVQEVVRMILEQIYEAVFKDSSHGFRPQRSCHTALASIKHGWTGVKWMIDMDIKGFFDNIDHHVLIRCLEKQIDDNKFINIVKSMLKAGYIDDWQYHATHSGTPQGGIVSPILANIYLHELDIFMERMKADFDKEKQRQRNPEYRHYTEKIRKLRKEYDKCKENGIEEQLKAIRNQIRSHDKVAKNLPSYMQMDSSFRRLMYCRYADDFIIGVIGSKEDCKHIMTKIREYILRDLHLEIAEEKSGIHHAKEGVLFLGYNVAVYDGIKVIKTVRSGRHTTQRSISDKIQLHIPEEKLIRFCQKNGIGSYDGFTMQSRINLINLGDAEIIRLYNAELRGLANYYALSEGAIKALNKLQAIWFGSLLKTLAHKHGTSVKETARRLKIRPGDYELSEMINGKRCTIKVYSLKDLKWVRFTTTDPDPAPNTIRQRAVFKELARRMRAQQCEYCGRKGGNFEVHHVGTLEAIACGEEAWKELMRKMRRKTLVMCVDCHNRLHAGNLPDL